MKDKLIGIAVIILFVLFSLNITASIYFYKQYNDNFNSLNQQNWLNKVKLENLEKNADSFKDTLETLNNQFKNYDQNITNLEKRTSSSESDTKEVLAKMQSIKLDIEDWQKKYEAVLKQIGALKEATEKITSNVEQVNKEGGNVDLGKISVKNEGEEDLSAENTETAGEPQARSKTNFATSKTEY